ncbi:phage portal protein [Enterobacter kobei]|uniref:phage portal protein n=1 Tax=Enterobacter kobei TaxID=208224 RepID=UPI002074BE59|nr:phage portal protein [Enterobacter kobei]MCM7552974.1 phage portal protein [Enterobacter kobei]
MDNPDKISVPEVTATTEQQPSAECFTFGDPIPVLDRRELLDYVECVQMDRWYEPPVSFAGLAKYTRRGVDLESYWFVNYGLTTQPYEFTRGNIFHLMEPDINQEIYGLPGYLSAIPSTLLNESATLFRRKYYINGSHAGFIMYMTDAAQNQEDVNNIRKAMKSAKGPGNFRNLFMYSPNGKKDGIQIIPLSEVAAKDEFLNIKNVSRDDMMAAHRVPPQMMGIIPNNTGGFGDVEKAARVFVRNELMPLQKRLQELNDWLGEEVMRFEPYDLEIKAE